MNGQKPEENTVATLFSRLIDDAERFVLAELRLYRARLFGRIGAMRAALVMAVGGLLLAQSTVVVVLMGILLLLRRPFGLLAATALVALGALLAAGLLIWLALGQIRRATAIEQPQDKPSAHQSEQP